MNIYDKWIKSQYIDLKQGKKLEIMITNPDWYLEQFEKLNGVVPILTQVRHGWYNVSLQNNEL